MNNSILKPSVFAFCLLAIPTYAQEVSPLAKIDVHQHGQRMRYLTDGSPPPIPCPNHITPCALGPSIYGTDDGLIKGTLEYMRRHNVVRAITSDYDYDRLAEWTSAAPDRFVISPMLRDHPQRPEPRELRQKYEDGTFQIMGEITFQYSGRAPNDPAIDPYFSLAEEFDVPVLIHTAGIGANRRTFRSALGDPLLLEEVLKRHPKLRLWVENGGYPFGDRMIALLYQYPQIYTDLSTISWIIPRTAFHDYLERLVRAGFVKRLMFGSDQMIWPETIGMAVEAIESAPFLSEADKRDIFFNNAVRFFRWDSDELMKLSWYTE